MSVGPGPTRLGWLQASSSDRVSISQMNSVSRLTACQSPEIPMNEYYEYFGPTYQLDVLPTNMEDLNTPEYLEKVKTQVFENLRHTAFAPSVQMSGIPKLDRDDMEVDEDLDPPDVRKPRESDDKLFERCD